ncbi:hypothetical protein ON010_g15688 [Phytophthora cinnamomi]|nr:hypothetical protein ON010_g15688 [Phytophthora cinnamomi]
MEELKQQAKAKAREGRGRGATPSATMPRTSAKKPRTTSEASGASRPRSQQPSGSQPGAVPHAPTSFFTLGNPSISREVGACLRDAAPRGSAAPHSGQGRQAVA